MDINNMKNEINIDLNKNENQNNNDAAVVTKKIKNTGILTINNIYTNAKTPNEKLKLLESEYLKLQYDFYELKKEFINYKENQNWSEVLIETIYLTSILGELEKNKINYKILSTNDKDMVKFLVKIENQGKALEILADYI
ncbi:hypothetical protein [Spiroplasma attinicola]|uniref:hypothetical protein n=1 Tax=Spiroplasma attinicola TaxID=2904537 RepID=UPI002022A89F|nr:hypothetical protein [Spiroplasma sp. JKS002670]MCL8209492.1 hypothetical protein [Spiroplasma sp. JKS002670]